MSAMNKIKWMIIFAFVTCFLHVSTAQVNVDSLSHVNYQALHGANLNDVWGYVDEFGNEYVLVGTSKGTSVVSIADPTNPQEVHWEAGEESIWRDVCTWGNYAYVTTEAESGLLILDLSSLPNPNGITSTYYNGTPGNEWASAHTLYIDSNGYAYIFGANRGNGGVIILDVHTDPLHPIEVGVFDNWYVHDGYVLNNTMYLAHIGEGFISMVDVTNKSNPILLGTKQTDNNFSHNIWTTSNGTYGFTTDEVSGAYIGSYDLSDPSNMVQLDRIQSSPGKGVIPHNTHVLGDFLITSYYSDGITIHDASRPHNLVQVGKYDTYPGQTINFDGCWGVYPFFPSGTIAASDITEGLFILSPTYVHAAFLEGIVTDASNGNPLAGVEVQFLNDDQVEETKSAGNYETGIIAAGLQQVTFSKVAYYPQTIDVNLTSNQVTNLSVELVPIPPFPLQILVKEAGTENPIFGADVKLEATLITHEAMSNGVGEIDLNLFYAENYTIIAGKWGFVTTCFEAEINAATQTLTIYLEKGIYDDFTFDFGWTASADQTVTSGLWERAKPNPSSTLSAPGADAQFDCGDRAFVTGNNPNLNPDEDDVDKGRVTLYSPIFDLTSFANPHINYTRWFYNFHGPMPPADDTLEIKLTNGLQTVTIDAQFSEDAAFYKWIPKSIRVLDFMQPSANMQLIITVADEEPAKNITEAGFDHFFVSEFSVLETTSTDKKADEIRLYPNPTNHKIQLESVHSEGQIRVLDVTGKCLLTQEKVAQIETIDLSNFPSGIYFFEYHQQFFKVIKD